MKKAQNVNKYGKIPPQKKFRLLTLVLRQNKLIKTAATEVGINYSTAKTILFFNRNGQKSYQFNFNKQSQRPKKYVQTMASFTDISMARQTIPRNSSLTSSIEIISTIGEQLQEQQKSGSFEQHRTSPFYLCKSNYHRENQDDYDYSGFNYRFKNDHQVGVNRPRTRSQIKLEMQQNQCKLQQQHSNFITYIKQQQS